MKSNTRFITLLMSILLAMNIFAACGNSDVDNSTVKYTASVGKIDKTVNCDGKLESYDTCTLEIPSNVFIDEVNFKVGDKVSSGDVLAVFNAESLAGEIARLSEKLEELDGKLDQKKIEEIYAPTKGIVKRITAEVGDSVIDVINENGYLMLISTDGNMKINITTESHLAINDKVTVKWDGGEAEASVAQGSQNNYLLMLKDDKAPYKETAQVYKDNDLIGEGVLEINAPISVMGTGGTIKKINCSVNDSVARNEVLITLENKANSTANIQLMTERDNVSKDLSVALGYLQNSSIIATNEGTVGFINLAKDQMTTDDSMIELHIGGAVKFCMKVDEVDIATVKVGQLVNVTLDAFPSKIYSGKVTRISNIGESSGKITVYAVEAVLDDNEGLLEGMNGSAEIVTESLENIITIPSDMVFEDEHGKYVMVVDDSGKPFRREIIAGVSDDNYIEIVDGLSEGEQVTSSAK